ncbi:ribosomal maturation YjgA family protein [Hymenobacter jeollabukensis]|uniref:DUF2809 domain-containing protein n=1 Tax=Hymenobacter jeollabukensis TaxID=2025313 RepID=A0A5R8WQ72_9BACT|nr:DUF2809 domain-containing protein [Hymenobacter jeollabukensis]TLM91923.1 DUF2809 domain-containing protein [Hymenobacter jeollabukensis]
MLIRPIASVIRLRYAILSGLVLGLGLASRRFRAGLPAWVGLYAGDVLWALLVFGLVSGLRPTWSARRRAAVAGAFSLVIELSQLWQAPWLQALRGTTPGALVLGRGFLWSDLACYAGGVLLGWALDGWLCRRPSQNR